MILHKADMYRRLNAGEFGNTIPRWSSVVDWWAANPGREKSLWAVQTAGHAGGGPAVFNQPAVRIPDFVQGYTALGYPVWITEMIHSIALETAWFDIWLGEYRVEGIEYPRSDLGWTWRSHMPDPKHRQAWDGSAARAILRRHLNPNSLDDLDLLADRFPGHVLELSALDRCFGTCPGRNAVVWEVRAY